MNSKFEGCKSLKNLDLSSFITSQSKFQKMIEGCEGLTFLINVEYNRKLIRAVPEYVTVNVTDNDENF